MYKSIRVANTGYECKSVAKLRLGPIINLDVYIYSEHLEYKLEIGNNSSVLV